MLEVGLGKACDQQVASRLPGFAGQRNIGKVRSSLREMLSAELNEITGLVAGLLSNASNNGKGLGDYASPA